MEAFASSPVALPPVAAYSNDGTEEEVAAFGRHEARGTMRRSYNSAIDSSSRLGATEDDVSGAQDNGMLPPITDTAPQLPESSQPRQQHISRSGRRWPARLTRDCICGEVVLIWSGPPNFLWYLTEEKALGVTHEATVPNKIHQLLSL
jgi:hypothetical protein